MPALNAGSNITLTMGADDSVSVEVNAGASCVVEQPVGTRVAVVGAGSRQFGPYAGGAQVRLSAEGGGIVYNVSDGTASPYLTESQQAATQALVSGAGVRAADLYDELGTIPAATYGDSRATIVPAPTRFDLRTFAQPAGQVFTTYLERGMVQSFYPQIRWVANGGVAGETLAQLLARETAAAGATRKSIADIASTGARMVFFRAGINDVTPLTTFAGGPEADPAVQALIASRQALIDRITSAGMVVVDEGLHGIEPLTPGAHTTYHQAVCKYLDGVFQARAALASTKVLFVAVADAVGDGAGGFLPGTVDNDNISGTLGLHLTAKGAQMAYGYVAAALERAIGPARSRTWQSGSVNAVTDAFFDAVTVESYGTRANNITVVAAGSPFPTRQNAKIEFIDGVRMQTCEWICTVAGDQTAQLTLSLAEIVGGSATSPVAPGEVWACEFDVFVDFGDAPLNLKAAAASINSELRITCGANIYFWWSASSQYYLSPEGQLRMRVTHPRVLITEASSAVTAATVYFRVILNEVATIKLGIGAPVFKKL